MRGRRVVSAWAVVLSLAGCMTHGGPVDPRYRYDGGALSDANSAVVIGRLTTPAHGGVRIAFARMGQQDEIVYRDAGTFCLRLPPGPYGLVGIDLDGRGLTADKPLLFDVAAGQVAYVGSLYAVPPDSDFVAPPGTDVMRIYRVDGTDAGGAGSRRAPLWHVHVLNRIEDVRADYQRGCPGLPFDRIRAHPMR